MNTYTTDNSKQTLHFMICAEVKGLVQYTSMTVGVPKYKPFLLFFHMQKEGYLILQKEKTYIFTTMQ